MMCKFNQIQNFQCTNLRKHKKQNMQLRIQYNFLFLKSKLSRQRGLYLNVPYFNDTAKQILSIVKGNSLLSGLFIPSFAHT